MRSREPVVPNGLATPASDRLRGFTLIEMLVVMAIVGSLVAILIPVISAARRLAKIGATKTLLAQIETALERYNDDWGAYPPDTSVNDPNSPTGQVPKNDTSPPACLYFYLVTPDLSHHHPYLELQAERQCMNTNDGDPEYDVIIDSWGRAFQYVGTNPARNPKSFDLWSLGPTNVPDANPIGNWE
jgi:prepilin-type N-terminal cleavage/methylation domain-containing protein